MLVSTKGRYALRVMLELAKADGNNYIQLESIATEQEISEKYLESIVSMLVKQRLIEGLRGRGGGYRLCRTPEKYTVGEILRATEGSLAPVACLDCSQNKCSRAGKCDTLPMWKKLDERISSFLDGITLKDLLS